MYIYIYILGLFKSATWKVERLQDSRKKKKKKKRKKEEKKEKRRRSLCLACKGLGAEN